MSWHCPSCGASCRTAETLGIHVSKCRAMSVEEIEGILETTFRRSWTNWEDSKKLFAKAIHAFHVAKLRGRKP